MYKYQRVPNDLQRATVKVISSMIGEMITVTIHLNKAEWDLLEAQGNAGKSCWQVLRSVQHRVCMVTGEEFDWLMVVNSLSTRAPFDPVIMVHMAATHPQATEVVMYLIEPYLEDHHIEAMVFDAKAARARGEY